MANPNYLLLLLSRSRSHSLKPSQTLTLIRSLCSSRTPIKPVSYPPKPKSQQPQNEPSPSPSPPSSSPQPPPQRPLRDDLSRPWTREDIRFVKDAPSISPVSYPTRVAPLPEDRTNEEEKEKKEEEEERGDEELRREARRIQSDGRVMSMFGLKEEEKIPFPAILKKEKRPQKLPMDLSEALREIKVEFLDHFVWKVC